MILTNKQEEGLKVAVARFKAREPWTCIAGYAGSGKSTLVKFIISALDVPPEEVCYVAYTGKAATVLRQKGCPNAMTAHKLLYWSRPTPSGKFVFQPRTTLDGPYRVVVVDEVSMLPKDMWELLLSHRVYVLALGDPGQLPPIDKDKDNHVLDNPHVFLDEIMRQAQESEIIRLSMHVREGNPIETFEAVGDQVLIYKEHQMIDPMYEWADQILCATNSKRFDINNKMRELRGYGPEPMIGDKIISLSNHWDISSDNGEWALTNGTIGTLTNHSNELIYLPKFISTTPIEIMNASFDFADGEDSFTDLMLDYHKLKTNIGQLTSRQSYQMNKCKTCPNAPLEFNYAYAITTWKAQGSEWDKVLGFEESFPYGAEHQNYLYTLITRAKEKLVLITQ